MNGRITVIRGDGAFPGGTVLDGTPWSKLLEMALDKGDDDGKSNELARLQTAISDGRKDGTSKVPYGGSHGPLRGEPPRDYPLIGLDHAGRPEDAVATLAESPDEGLVQGIAALGLMRQAT